MGVDAITLEIEHLKKEKETGPSMKTWEIPALKGRPRRKMPWRDGKLQPEK